MIKNPEDFEIKYWAGGNDFYFVKPNKSRSFKKRIVIVASFIGLLSFLPIILIVITNLNIAEKGREVAIQTPLQIEVEENQSSNNQNDPITIEAGVINNDSWWKISDRICGSGRYYLEIQEQNNSKALFEGDIVTVKCPI